MLLCVGVLSSSGFILPRSRPPAQLIATVAPDALIYASFKQTAKTVRFTVTSGGWICSKTWDQAHGSSIKIRIVPACSSMRLMHTNHVVAWRTTHITQDMPFPPRKATDHLLTRWSLWWSASVSPSFHSLSLCLYWPLLEKTCPRLKCCHKNLVSARQPLRFSRGLELILDTKLGHFYHGLSSVCNLKAWPEVSIARMLFGVFTGPARARSHVPL